MAINRDKLAEILDRLSPSQVYGIGDAKPSGRVMVATCPFCGKRDKFTYTPNGHSWWCLSSSCPSDTGLPDGTTRAKDWIDFTRARHGFTFNEAVEYLAGMAGVKLEWTEQDRIQAETRAKRRSILETANAYFVEQLPSSPVWDYLVNGRGYSQEAIEAMGLGAYTSQERLIKHLAGHGFSRADVNAAGLLTNGLATDYQLTIPLRRASGAIEGFSIRVLPSSDVQSPKYKYTTNTRLSETLTGLANAKRQEDIVLVEGALDALCLQAHGVQAVALGGTSLSEYQINLLLEHQGGLYLALDSDPAGKKAVAKICQGLAKSALNIAVAQLPAGKDPDEIIIEQGVDSFYLLLDEAIDWSPWLAGHYYNEAVSAVGQSNAVNIALKHLPADPHFAAQYMQALADVSGFSLDAIQARLSTPKPAKRDKAPRPSHEDTSAPSVDPDTLIEATLLGAILLGEPWASVSDLRPDDFALQAHQDIFEAMAGLAKQGHAIDHVTVLHRLQAMGKANGANAYLLRLVADTPASYHLATYAEMVLDAANRRRLARLGQTLTSQANNPQRPTLDTLAEARVVLTAVHERSISSALEIAGIGETAADAYINFESDEKLPYFSTGMPAVDERLAGGGLTFGQFVIIASLPNEGKSLMLKEMAMHLANQELKVLYLNFEDSIKALSERMVSSMMGVNTNYLERRRFPPQSNCPNCRGSGWLQTGKACGCFSDTAHQEAFKRKHKQAVHKLLQWEQEGRFIAVNTILSPSQIATLAQRHAPQVLVVDYLQIAGKDDPKQNMTDVATECSRQLQTLAQSLNCIVLSAAQLNRDAAKGVPTLQNMAESRFIERDAHVVFALTRDVDEAGNQMMAGMLRCLKQKHAGKFSLPVRLEPNYARFEVITPKI